MALWTTDSNLPGMARDTPPGSDYAEVVAFWVLHPEVVEGGGVLGRDLVEDGGAGGDQGLGEGADAFFAQVLGLGAAAGYLEVEVEAVLHGARLWDLEEGDGREYAVRVGDRGAV